MAASINTISIIGVGNVGTYFAESLHKSGYSIQSVYGRNFDNASTLAGKVGARAITCLKEINQNSDLYIIAIKDDSISDLVQKLKIESGLVVHTSGSIEMDVLEGVSKRIGVLYPLQTFSKGNELHTRSFPICIEARKDEDLDALEEFSEGLVGKDKVYKIDTSQRKTLHIAAVFACNFTNYLYSIAEDLMTEKQLPFEMLRPLIVEMMDKSNKNLPSSNQTGPAKRNDIKVMKEHLEILKTRKEYQEIYKVISEAIINRYNK